jgi:uncharacterized membrane protein
MRVAERMGAIFFGLALIGFGVQNFFYRGVLAGLEFVPEGIPAHTALAYLAGALFLVTGLSFVLEKRVEVTAAVMGFVLLACTIWLAPRLIQNPADLRERTRVFEMLSVCGGAWVWAGQFAIRNRPSFTSWLAVMGRLFLAVSLVIFGVDHLEIPAFIASLIPAWIPFRLFWAWFTGFALIAAGISFGVRRWTRAAGLWLGLLFALWVIVLHVPRVAGALHNGNEWNSALVCLAMSGAALGVAVLGEAAQENPEARRVLEPVGPHVAG